MFAKNLPATSTPNQNQMLNVKISMIGQQKNLSAERLTGSLAERGREKKKTSIFGTLRKRLSRSRNRNDGTNGTTEGHDQFDSKKNNFSTDTALKNASLKSNTSGPMTKYIPGLSRRSSLSEMSGVSRMSSISNKTFLHEASSLVLEVVENGVKRWDYLKGANDLRHSKASLYDCFVPVLALAEQFRFVDADDF